MSSASMGPRSVERGNTNGIKLEAIKGVRFNGATLGRAWKLCYDNEAGDDIIAMANQIQELRNRRQAAKKPGCKG